MPLDFRDRRALDDLLRYAADAVGHATGLSQDAFITDRKSHQAAMYAIATVAEAASKLSAAVTILDPSIPWPMIRGMRNILLHEYGRVDLTVVYRVVTEELPILIERVTALRRTLEG